jgi:adenylate cyclase
MKILGEELNKKFIAEKMTPAPLLTRFGINTGEMVAGNMGTERKMNYTVMGNAVNLAARLEGVNKMYGTWILTTDYTAKEAGDEFIYRRLDQVRVVGINTPVQLLEVIDFKNSISSERESFLKDFEKALDLFNERNYKAAQEIFDNLVKINAEDGPSTIYRDRCIDFIKSPPAKDWDGVFNLTQK